MRKEEVRTVGNRRRGKREAQEAGKVVVAPGATVKKLGRFGAAQVGLFEVP